MGLADRLEALASPGKSGSDLKSLNTPENWRPRMDIDSVSGGFLISQARPEGESLGAKEVLEEFNLNPEDWNITSVRLGKWQKYDGEYLESQRVNVVPAATSLIEQLDAEKLIDEIKKWRPAKGIKQATGRGSFALFPADQQIGKKAGGGGTQQSIDRILGLTNSAVERFKGYQKMGMNLGTITLGLPGDHVEGNVSQGGRLQGLAASDLGLTEQVRVARRLLMAQIKALSPLAENMVVPVINGNHDETGRYVATDPADGWNVEIASSVQDACAENPALQHIKFRYPSSGHQTLVTEICGTHLGMFHGHQANQNSIEKYLAGQTLGQTALGGADIWVSGHFHNFRTMDVSERLWVQCPTTDPGSDWFRDRAGHQSRAGLLTMVFGGDYDPRENISVLSIKG
jgi:predicted phosphodiesterase